MITDSNTIAQLAVAVTLGLAAVSIGLQKLLKGWKEDSTETSIISIMHNELERMAMQNKVLADELSKLQLEIIKLSKQLHKLTIENQKLNLEITSLTKEVTRLQETLKTAGVDNVS